MSLFFKLHMSVELQDSPQAFSDIAAEFPSEYVDNRFLKTKQALMYYYNRGIFLSYLGGNCGYILQYF